MAGNVSDVAEKDMNMAGKRSGAERVTWHDERSGGKKKDLAGSFGWSSSFRHLLVHWRWAIIDRALRPVAFLTSRLCRNSDLGIGFYCKKSAMRVRHCFSRAPRTSIAHKTVHHNHNKRASLFAHHSSTISTFISYGPLSRIDTSILLFIILPSPSSPSNHEDL